MFGGSSLVLGRASEKEKHKIVKLVSKEGKLFLKIWFLTTFMKVTDIFKKGINGKNAVKIKDIKYLIFKVEEKVQKSCYSLSLQNKTKTIFFLL